MKFNITALAITASMLWGGAIFVVSVSNLIWPSYGLVFLDLIASIYPGYHPGNGLASALVATLYGIVDGAIGGAIFAWLYNLLARKT